jgi:hypothetical protein
MLFVINFMKGQYQEINIDRSAFSIVTREEAQKQDIAFWQSKTPLERLEALESLRQTTYGYDPAITHIERVFEVVKRKIDNLD